jgi:predicted permease
MNLLEIVAGLALIAIAILIFLFIIISIGAAIIAWRSLQTEERIEKISSSPIGENDNN